jgi:iron complex outermembrane receptor protein
MLEEITAQDLRDVGPQSPNVHIQANTFAPNSSTIHIRGMGSLTIESTNELRNGVAVNGVYISRPVATLIDFFDVDTVEVLRGPQGTTFGKNSLSGAVSVNTVRPDGTLDWDAEVTGGNYGRVDVRGAVQFPIIGETLSARIAVLSQTYEGHYKNRFNGGHLNGEDVDTVRGTLVWEPTDSFDATLIYQWLKERSDAPGGDNEPDPGQIITFLGYTGEPDNDPFTVGRDSLDFYNTDQDNATLIMNWDIGRFTLTSITGWAETDDVVAADFDQTELLFFPTFRDQVHEQWSQELRLHSDFSDMGGFLGNLEMVLGLFYFEQEHEIVQTFPTLGAPALGLPSSADYAHQENESKAAFGQVIYALTDDLNVSAGIRYTDETKDFERNPGTNFPLINYKVPGERPSIGQMSQTPMTVTGDLDSDRVTFKLAVDYHFFDNVMGYASYSQGFKAGEFGARANSNTTAGPTDDETSEAFEAGIKADFFDGRLRTNATVFYTNYEDLAFEVFFPSPSNPTGQETASQNIGEASVVGLELEATAVPFDGLTLQGVVGLMDHQYDDFCADLDGPQQVVNPVSDCGGNVVPVAGGFLVDIDHTDLELSRAPDIQVYFSAMYEWNTSIGGFFVRGASSYESEYFSDGALNHPNGKTGDFWLFDASLGWLSLDEKWRLQFWCKNCGDKEYTSGLTPTANFFNQHFWGYPQQYGATLAYHH